MEAMFAERMSTASAHNYGAAVFCQGDASVQVIMDLIGKL
jgi:hypothetical protein